MAARSVHNIHEWTALWCVWVRKLLQLMTLDNKQKGQFDLEVAGMFVRVGIYGRLTPALALPNEDASGGVPNWSPTFADS